MFLNFLKFFKKNTQQIETEATKYALESEVCKKNNQLKHSLIKINKAIKLSSKNDSYLYQRGLVLILMKKYKQALTDINNAVKINPNIYYYYLTRADIYSLMNKEQDETENLNKAFTLLPKAYLYYAYQQRKAEENNKSDQSNFYKTRLIRFRDLFKVQ